MRNMRELQRRRTRDTKRANADKHIVNLWDDSPPAVPILQECGDYSKYSDFSQRLQAHLYQKLNMVRYVQCSFDELGTLYAVNPDYPGPPRQGTRDNHGKVWEEKSHTAFIASLLDFLKEDMPEFEEKKIKYISES